MRQVAALLAFIATFAVSGSAHADSASGGFHATPFPKLLALQGPAVVPASAIRSDCTASDLEFVRPVVDSVEQLIETEGKGRKWISPKQLSAHEWISDTGQVTTSDWYAGIKVTLVQTTNGSYVIQLDSYTFVRTNTADVAMEYLSAFRNCLNVRAGPLNRAMQLGLLPPPNSLSYGLPQYSPALGFYTIVPTRRT